MIGPLRLAAAVMAAAALLPLAGCGHGQSGPGKPEAPSPSSRSSAPSAAGTSSAALTKAPAAGACRGVGYDQVRGTEPSYPPHRLRDYRADRTLCAAYWMKRSAADFVPQSLAVDGRRAYVGGYLKRPSFGAQACQIEVLDLRTGRETGFQAKFQAPVYRAKPTFCRHGGGMQLTSAGLWVQETQRLWLLDPDRVGSSDVEAPVRRVWRMQKGIRGSTMVVDGDRFGVASFRVGGSGRIVWFRTADLLRSGVDDLVLSGGDDTDARAIGSDTIPALVQGVATYDGGLWYAISGTGCAALIGPDGRRHAFAPGAEDLEFHGSSLWTLSESGSEYLVRGASGTVPPLLRFDRARLLKLGPDCR